ncbi:MAG TPA: zf-HC2 domain-containing protein [Bryobacteraceae bacterium]|nr:zf-HC2 domain-containing protein [Bryobacteraceae bacterium]
MEDTNMPGGMEHHLEEEQVEKYSMGCLPDAELAPIEEHLLTCEACRARISSHDDFAVAMKTAASQLRREPAKEKARLFVFPRLVPMAAAAALIVVLAAVGTRVVNHTRAPAFAVSLQAMRGAGVGTQAPAGRPLILQLDLAGLPPVAHRVEVVDASGAVVWKGPTEGPPSPAGSTAAVSMPGLNAGVYFVRVYASPGGLLREYGLEATR